MSDGKWVSESHSGGLLYVGGARSLDGTVMAMPDGREFTLTFIGWIGRDNIFQARYVRG